MPSVVVLPLGAGDAVDVAAAAGLVKGDLGRAHTVWAALDHGAYYVTAEPHLAPSVIPEGLLHTIPADGV